MACISDLPDEILVTIFSYLDVDDICLSVRNVCRQWRSVSEDDNVWMNMYYCPRKTTTKQELISKLKTMPSLRYFVYTGTHNVLGTMSKHCTKLKDLHIPYMEIRARHLRKAIRHLHYLEGLSVRITSRTARFTQIIGESQHLVRLSLTTGGGLHTTDQLLEPIASGCRKLKKLRCAYLDCPTEELCRLLQHKKRVLEEYEHCGRLSAAVFTAINGCKKLKKLRFNSISIEGPFDETISFVKLKYLTLVEFAGCPITMLKSVSRSLSIAPVSCLEQINLSFSDHKIDSITDSVFLACPSLKRLILAGNIRLCGYGLRNIKNCKMLEYLDMRYCLDLDWTAIKYVAEGSPRLQYLDLSGNHITLAMFQQILKCKNLKTLLLKGCDLRGFNLRHIKTRIPGLKHLKIE